LFPFTVSAALTSQTPLNTMPANVLQPNSANTQLLKTSTGLANGTTVVQSNQGNQPQLSQLSAGIKNNISISAIPHQQFVITNTNVPSSLTSNTIVSKASSTPITMSMAGKPGQALLLTTKDGQQTTMVVQQGPNVSGVPANTTDVTSGSNIVFLNLSSCWQRLTPFVLLHCKQVVRHKF
jgi:hypothetical protein